MSESEALKRLLQTCAVDILVAPDLVSVLSQQENGTSVFQATISYARKALADEVGLPLGKVRVRDSLHLEDHRYMLMIHDSEVGQGLARPNQMLLLLPDTQDRSEIKSPIEVIREPAYGLEAAWIGHEEANHYLALGFNAVSAMQVISTHLSQVCRMHAHQLFRIEALLGLIESERELSPRLIDYLIPERITVERLHKLLCEILRHKMSLAPFSRVLEHAAHYEAIAGTKPPISEFMADKLKAFGKD